MSAAAAAVVGSNGLRLDRRRVFIFPSKVGFIMGAVLLVILLGAINYDNALAYMLTFLLGGLFVVAMLHTYRNLAGLRFIDAWATPVFAGESAQFHVALDNDAKTPRLQLYIKHWPRARTREERRYLRQFATRFDIPPSSSAAPTVTVDAFRRGLVPLNRVVLHTVYPLGLLRAWAYFEPTAVALVYPRPRGELALPRAADATAGGMTRAALGNDNFAGLRVYAPGDPVRAIAWKTLAKEQDLMVKRFDGQAAARIWLTWAALDGIDGLEAKLSQLCAWVLQAHQQRTRYGMELPGLRLELGEGAQHRDRCLQALALYAEPT